MQDFISEIPLEMFYLKDVRMYIFQYNNETRAGAHKKFIVLTKLMLIGFKTMRKFACCAP